MKGYKKLKLGTKLSIVTVLITGIMLSAVFGFLGITNQKAELSNARENVKVTAEKNAYMVKAEIEVALDSARTLAQVFSGYKDIPTSDRRDTYNTMLKQVAESNERFLAVWTCWEPNALDKLDARNINTKGHDVTGRFIPYWAHTENGVECIALTDYEIQGPGDYYQVARVSGKETILEPYEYVVNNEAVLMTSVAVPIKDDDGTVIAVAGIDISLDALNHILFSKGSYKGSNVIILSNQGTIVNHHKTAMIGESITQSISNVDDVDEVLAAVRTGTVHTLEQVDESTEDIFWNAIVPVKVGSTDTPWALGMSVPMSQMERSSKRSFNTMITYLLVILVFLTIAIIVAMNKMVTKPIAKVVEQANQMAIGDLEVDVQAATEDEIGDLINAFGALVENIKEQTQNAEEVAKGNLAVDITPRSEKDVLAKSMQLVVRSIKGMVVEADKLTQAVVEGKLNVRGNADAFAGGYKAVIDGFNKTFDAIVEPINEASSVLSWMAQGDLGARVTGDYQGDFEQIKKAVNSTGEQIQGYIAEISRILTDMANGNLDITIDRNYHGDFDEIKRSIHYIVDQFNHLMSELQDAAEQVAAGAQEVSNSSQTLSQGSTEQASSVEEISATITQVAAQTKQNAINANKANEITEKARLIAAKGNDQMQDMLVAMNDINEASNNISKVIKLIDDISFQTNMLALNAAVEAARAGEHGRGFAVVAEEVRNLAARSANAAKETTDMIDHSIKKANGGTNLANETARALGNIVNGVTEAGEIVADISNASNEQASAIAQINAGIMQVSDVTQSNTATAEQSASASEVMANQAQLLNDMVAKFTLKNSAKKLNPVKTERIDKTQSKNVEDDEPQIKIALDDSEFGKY